jgi:N-acetylglucosaminyldiphosphoundecaprenol N-acetyl-beta-D-mannosaminyltransferase
MNNFISIAGIKIYNGSLSSLLSNIQSPTSDLSADKAGNRKPKTIMTANPEIIVQAQNDSKLKEILNSSSAAIPDGIGIMIAAQCQRKPITERITGVRLTQELLKIATKNNRTVGVIGGSHESSLKYSEYLNKQLTTNSWVLPGPWIESKTYEEYNVKLKTWCDSKDGKDLLKKLEKTSILFVAMGAPKQEYFIDYVLRHTKYNIRNTLFIAVGGTFDELSGIVLRPAKWIEDAGLKWLYRLVSQPWRLKRQTRLLRFIQLVIRSQA